MGIKMLRRPGPGKNIFKEELLNTDVGTVTTYTPFAVDNGVYTMSSKDFPLVSRLDNVFFLAGNVTTGASSLVNGVHVDFPVTITVTDGYFTVAYRSDSNANHNNPKNFHFQIEKGSAATSYEPYQEWVYHPGVLAPIVPGEYECVEYIESSGTQWINTGIIPNNYTDVELDYSKYGRGSVYIFGTRVGSVQQFTMSGSASGGTNTNSVNDVSANIDVGARVANAWNRLFQKLTTNNGIVTWSAINKDTKESNSGTYDATIPSTVTKTIVLFGNGNQNDDGGRIYSCKLRQNNVLVRDFIPVKKKSNNEYGMYDLVTKQYYGNGGSGSFTGGSVIQRYSSCFLQGGVS